MEEKCVAKREGFFNLTNWELEQLQTADPRSGVKGMEFAMVWILNVL
jgi:hypothetical protein